jgi:nitronate monooxygenase
MRSNVPSTSSVSAAAARGVVKWRTRLTEWQDRIVQQHRNNNISGDVTAATWTSIPIVSAPMAGHAGGRLAATVCNAGGVGMIGGGHWLSDAMNDKNVNRNQNRNKTGLEQLHDEITIFDEYNQSLAPNTKFPLSIGFIGHSTFATTIVDGNTVDGGGWERLEYVLKTYEPAMVQFFGPAISFRSLRESQSSPNGGEPQESNVQLVHRCTNHNTKVFVQVGTVAEAVEAIENHADGIIVQGSEAGGHGVRRELGSGTLSLVANVIHRIRGHAKCCKNDDPNASNVTLNLDTIPILAAGGIADGATTAAVMALGCDGVVIGTRFWASSESIGLPTMKERLVTTQSCDDIVRTTTFDCIQNTYSKTPWSKPYDSVGAIKNETYYHWENRSDDLVSALQANVNDIVPPYQKACNDGNTNIALVHAGEGIGQIKSIDSAHDIVHTISNDAITIIQNLSRSVLQTTSK